MLCKTEATKHGGVDKPYGKKKIQFLEETLAQSLFCFCNTRSHIHFVITKVNCCDNKLPYVYVSPILQTFTLSFHLV